MRSTPIIGAVLCAILALSAHAATYYVRSTGNDANAGTTPANAWRTLAKAASLAQPGDIIYIGAGTYTEPLAPQRSGSANQPVRWIADTPGTFTGDAGAVTVQPSGSSPLSLTNAYSHHQFTGFRFATNNNSGTVALIAGGTGVTLTTCTLTGGQIGVRVTNGGHVTLISSAIDDTEHAGVRVESGGAALVDCTITNQGDDALNATSSDARIDVSRVTIHNVQRAVCAEAGIVRIVNSIIRTARGEAIYAGNSNAQVYAFGLTAYDIGGDAVYARDGDAWVYNSVFSRVDGSALQRVNSSSSITHTHNIFHNVNGALMDGTGLTLHSSESTSDPRFTNPATGDFTLGTNSPARNTGAAPTTSYFAASGSMAALSTGTDRAGNARPRQSLWDMGAHESAGVATPATVPYSTDFQGTLDAEWSNATATTYSATTRVLGPFANAGSTLTLATIPGTTYTLEFDLFIFDTWDGNSTQWGPDYFEVLIAGSTALSHTFHSSLSGPQSFNLVPRVRSQYNARSLIDSRYPDITLNFTATASTTTLQFRGRNLQGGGDETWAIDNLTVVRARQVVAADLPFFDDCEASDNLAWSDATRTLTTTLTAFRGPHGRVNSVNRSTTLRVNTTPGTRYRVEFDMYLLDGIEGSGSDADRFRVQVNGTPQFYQTFTSNGTGTWPRSPDASGNFVAGTGSDYIYRRVFFDFVAAGTVADLRWQGLMTADTGNESWGLDNVAVYDPLRPWPTDRLDHAWSFDDAPTPDQWTAPTPAPRPGVVGVAGRAVHNPDACPVPIPITSTLSTTAPLTLSFWLRFASHEPPTGPILLAGSTTVATYNALSRTLTFPIGPQTLTLPIAQPEAWAHYAIIYDPVAQTVRARRNGTPVHTLTGVDARPFSITTLRFGGSSQSPGFTLDEVRLYDLALTEPELRVLANRPWLFTDVSDATDFNFDPDAAADASAGLHFADFTNDGLLDLFVSGNEANFLQQNPDLTWRIEWDSSGYPGQAALFDVDNNGLLDIYSNALRVWNDPGSPTGQTVSGTLGILGPTVACGIAAADLDLDGRVDLAAFASNGNFAAYNRPAADPLDLAALDTSDDPALGLNAVGAFGTAGPVSTADANNDGRLDFFSHFDGGRLFLSRPDGTFYPQDNFGIGQATNPATPAGSAWGDYDNDGDLDLFIPSAQLAQRPALFRNDGLFFDELILTDVTLDAGITSTDEMRSAAWGDYDNDGDLDLYITTAADRDNLLYENNLAYADAATFTPIDVGAASWLSGQDAVFVDVDNDLDLDLAMTVRGSNAVLLRNTTTVHDALRVRLTATPGGSLDPFQIGAHVELWSAGARLASRQVGLARGLAGTEPMWLHFGGLHPQRPVTLRVRWPGQTNFLDTPATPALVNTDFPARSVPGLLTIERRARSVAILRWYGLGQEEARAAALRAMAVRDGQLTPSDQRLMITQRRLDYAHTWATLRNAPPAWLADTTAQSLDLLLVPTVPLPTLRSPHPAARSTAPPERVTVVPIP